MQDKRYKRKQDKKREDKTRQERRREDKRREDKQEERRPEKTRDIKMARASRFFAVEQRVRCQGSRLVTYAVTWRER